MNLADYLLDTDGVDWSAVLATWDWLLPREFTAWFANRYGDLFIVLPDCSVHMLDVGGGSLKQLASSKDKFSILIDEGNNPNDWLMIPLVDRVVAAGLVLSPGRCYGYRLSPVLGGDYTVKNTAVFSIAEHYGFNGDLLGQMKDLPEGAKVVLRVKGEPGSANQPIPKASRRRKR